MTDLSSEWDAKRHGRGCSRGEGAFANIKRLSFMLTALRWSRGTCNRSHPQRHNWSDFAVRLTDEWKFSFFFVLGPGKMVDTSAFQQSFGSAGNPPVTVVGTTATAIWCSSVGLIWWSSNFSSVRSADIQVWCHTGGVLLHIYQSAIILISYHGNNILGGNARSVA